MERFGLGLLAHTFESVFTVIKWLSITYLLYLAWRFWCADYQDLTVSRTTGKTLITSCVTGLIITMGNPKAIAFYLALMPLVLDVENISVVLWASVLVPTAVVVLLLVGSFYILGVRSVRKALSSTQAQQRLHRIASVAMAGAAVSIFFRDL